MSRNPYMITDYRDDLKLFRGRGIQIGMLVAALVWLVAPLQLEDAWLGILNQVAVFAIGGIGLNLLTGFTGQVSLGHAFFMGVGAFTAAYLGSEGLPMLVWASLAVVIGAGVGALVGPVALRLHGNYLAIVSIGLLFLGHHIFLNWESVTGGVRGKSARFPMAIGPVDFNQLELLGTSYTRIQGRFWLLWAVVALVALMAKNIVRSRPGRAMQAIRDRDVAAEVVGISLFRYKIGAFAVSSGIAALSGAFLATAILGSARPEVFGSGEGLVKSIQFVAIIIIGGMGTIQGSILGAFVVAGLPRLIERYSGAIPFLDGGFISVASFNNALFGILVVVFLLVEPLGLAGVWMRMKAYFKTWPFSY
jgi:branched-chain amino acid transport system permease protein